MTEVPQVLLAMGKVLLKSQLQQAQVEQRVLKVTEVQMAIMERLELHLLDVLPCLRLHRLV